MNMLIEILVEVFRRIVRENVKGILILTVSLSFLTPLAEADEVKAADGETTSYEVGSAPWETEEKETEEREEKAKAQGVARKILKGLAEMLKVQNAKAAECSKREEHGTSDFDCAYAYRTVNALSKIVNEATKEGSDE